MSEEGLDNIFKEGLSGRDVKFNMEAWRNMEQMLPPETKGGYFSKSAAAIVVGFLFVVSASVFVWSYNQSDNDGLLAQDVERLEEEQPIVNDSILNITAKLDERSSIRSSSNKTIDTETRTSAEANNASSIVDNNKNDQAVSANNDEQLISKTNRRNTQKSNGLGKRTNTGVSFDLDRKRRSKNKRSSEEKITFSGSAFTKISGLDEVIFERVTTAYFRLGNLPIESNVLRPTISH